MTIIFGWITIDLPKIGSRNSGNYVHGRVRQTSNTAKIIRPGQGGKSPARREQISKEIAFCSAKQGRKSSALRKQITKEIAFCFAKQRGFRQRIKGGALYGMVFRYFLLWA